MALVLNFFEPQDCMETLAEHYGIDYTELEMFLMLNLNNDNVVRDMIEKFDINIMEFDTQDVRITCKHVTTSSDELASFKKHGFLRLDEVLTIDTPVRRYLLEKGIEIHPQEQILTFNDYRFYLFKSDEDCKFCGFGGCQHEEFKTNGELNLIHKDFNCIYRRNIMSLTVSLYPDQGEIEFHIHGNDSTIVGYSCVGRSQELLLTLENAFRDILDIDLRLESDWQRIDDMKVYILEVELLAKDLESVVDGRFLGRFGEYLYFSLYDLDNEDFEALSIEKKENFFTNIYMIQHSISAFNGCNNGYAQLLPHIQLNFDDISYSEYTT